MKNSLKIQNIQDLHAEINRLKALSKEQEEYLSDQYTLLKNKVQAPARIFKNVMSLIPGSSVISGLFSATSSAKSGVKDKDWITRSIKLGALAAIDRLFLRRAGLFKRLIVGLLSQQAVEKINKNNATDLINKITDWLKPKKKKVSVSDTLPTEENTSYGIPPDSETY